MHRLDHLYNKKNIDKILGAFKIIIYEFIAKAKLRYILPK